MLTTHEPGSTVPLDEYGRLNAYSHVSLVPHEMLAAGCIPVVNDAVHNRIVLESACRYAPPNSQDLTAELETPVTIADFDSLSRAAASVHVRDVERRGCCCRCHLPASPRSATCDWSGRRWP
jgi:hypothetical protein